MLFKKSRTHVIAIVGMALIFGLLAVYVSGAERTETLTFQWDMSQTEHVKEFRMSWSAESGGPYTELTLIPFAGGDPGTYESPVNAVVTGMPATTESRYFVLQACGDVPNDSGGVTYLCSNNSNEVKHDFWIPFDGFEVPINFRVKTE